MMMTEEVTEAVGFALVGRHPYLKTPTVGLEVMIAPALVGRVRYYQRGRSGMVRTVEGSEMEWDQVGGAYLLEGESMEARGDRQAMLAMVWDLMGLPFVPNGPRRRAARWCAVWSTDGRVEIWRSTAETRGSREDQARERGCDLPMRVESFSKG